MRFNADPLDLSTDEEITSVLRRVGIWAALEDRGGLDGVLIDQPLSHGQQQLFCLARAIIRKNKNPSTVLIMDEATSSVDRDTDRLMQRLVKEEFGKHTIISVAHRVSCPEITLMRPVHGVLSCRVRLMLVILVARNDHGFG